MIGGAARSRRNRQHLLSLGGRGHCLLNIVFVAAILSHHLTRYLKGLDTSQRHPLSSSSSLTPSDGRQESSGIDVFSRLYSYQPARRYSYDEHGFAPGTKYTQAFIQAHQNPADCKGKQFIILRPFVSGLGSIIHVITLYLASAIEQDRILLLDEEFLSYSVDDGCDFNCLFEPISSCSVEYAKTTQFIDISFPDIPEFGLVPTAIKNTVRKEVAHHTLTPHFFKYWWRAQGAAYIARLNKRSLAAVATLRREKALHTGFRRAKTGEIPDKVAVPLPLPPGTVNVHVRHGDKGIEMTLVPFADYVAAAKQIVNLNPLGLKHSLFVSSEDPGVIEEAVNLTRSSGDGGAAASVGGTSPDVSWVVYVSHINRKNTSPMEQLHEFSRAGADGRTLGKTALMQTWMLQLMMALECDAFVGTRGSNWNRLIDELRCVWVNKCQGAYLEVGPDSDWEYYNYK